MKSTFLIFVALVATKLAIAQVVRDHRKPTTDRPPVTVKPVTTITKQAVILYEHAGYQGQSRTLGVGQHRLNDFNDVSSSIKVPAGMVAVLYEHAVDNKGYGIWVDLLEDRPDLSQLGLNDKVSYVNVFHATNNNTHVWTRNAMVNGQFVPGHWERKRATPPPPNTVAVVAPYLEGPVSTAPSVLAVNGPNTVISVLGVQTAEGIGLWEQATARQMGVIGNDYRGIEDIGSACFERGSNNNFIPDNLNFWYPQKRARDHRAIQYYKHTLTGTVRESKQFNISGTYQDYDVSVRIVPDPQCMYMITEGHRREYTGLMSAQWNASLHNSGQSDCDDPKSIAAFERVEAEIAEDYWPQGNHLYGRAYLTDIVLSRTNRKMCVYGPWIYDKGHCCQPEIHPAEQLWWSEPEGSGRKYNLNVVCDASRRFWWRHQMDDGTKRKPWGAPPIRGLFAVAFEYSLPVSESAINHTTKKFEVTNIKHHNVIEYPNANQAYNLVYQGRNIVSFLPHNNAFKVSFEHVGLVPGQPGKIRGFLVIETSVGVVTQIATEITVPSGNTFVKVRLPANSSPEQVPEIYETKFFKKEAGHYYFTLSETNSSSPPVRVIQ